MANIQKITPFLWYSKGAAEAAEFYCSIFPDSKIVNSAFLPSDSPSGPAGSVEIVEFVLFGQAFTAMSAGPLDPFNHAISLMVSCDTQDEIDQYWNGLLQGGVAEKCGWLIDKYGLSWQIVPSLLGELMDSDDPAAAKRTADAMLEMVKFDIAGLQAAHDG